MEGITLDAPRGLWEWLRLYRLYRTAFPKAERKPVFVILERWRKGKMDIWCLRRGDRFSGLAITINGEDLTLIDYLAVAEDCRGTGIGSAALGALREKYTGKALFLEIESVYEDVPNLAQRQRRKAFYLRCGLTPMQVMVTLFGVKMELLGFDCRITYDRYSSFYRENLGKWAAKHISPQPHPEA